MGAGAPRELESSSDSDRTLDIELSNRLSAALDRLDSRDAEFKAGRDEERYAQHVKIWNGVCKSMEQHLRDTGKLLNTTHQLSLDMGVEGGGPNARPWISEVNGKFGKLEFRMVDGNVSAGCGGETYGNRHISEISIDWTERMVVEWLTHSVT